MDIVLNDSDKVDITYSLYVKHMFFDFATRYRALHPTVDSLKTFELTDQDIEDFIAFLDERHFTYETETSKYLKQTLDVARHEDIDSLTLKEIEALEPKLKPSYREAIYRNLPSVKEALGGEIIQRYYFQEGHIDYLLRTDKELQQAIQAFNKHEEE